MADLTFNAIDTNEKTDFISQTTNQGTESSSTILTALPITIGTIPSSLFEYYEQINNCYYYLFLKESHPD